MNIEHWVSEVVKAYQLADKIIAQNYRSHLESQVSEDTITTAEREFNSEVLDVMTYYFFKKATIGETFGPINRINNKFGKSLEANYGLKEGPFMNLARTYWTYKIEVQDLFPEEHDIIISQILMELEARIASIFFPTPGPVRISNKERKMSQEKILKRYAPEINIEDYFKNNPIIETSIANEQEALNVYKKRPILKIIVYIVGLYIVLNIVRIIYFLIQGQWENILIGSIFTFGAFILWSLLHNWARRHPK